VFYAAKQARRRGKNPTDRRTHRKLQQITLYVVRVSPAGQLRYSAPCAECYQTIRNIGIHTIVYTDEDGRAVKTRVRDYYTSKITFGTKYIRELI